MSQTMSPNIIRTCKLCGQSFHPTSRKQFYCNQLVLSTCEICGTSMDVVCNKSYTKRTCSDTCNAELVRRSKLAKLKTFTKQCAWCGKEFVPKTARDKYCQDTHYKKCEVCGTQFVIDVRNHSETKTCSSECKKVLQLRDRDFQKEHKAHVATMIQKYGVDNAMKIPGTIQKMKETNNIRYGADWYTQTDEYRDRVTETSLENYGVDHFLKSDEVIEKRQDSTYQRYGVNNVFQSDEVKAKSRETTLSKYGVTNISQCPEIQEKIRSSNMEKYGVSHPMMLPEFKDKAAQTCMEKYGRMSYTQQHISNIHAWYLFIDDPKSYIKTNYDELPTTRKLAEDLGVDVSTIDVHLNRNDALSFVKRAKSLMEEEITALIRSWIPDCQVINNTRSVIKDMELDIYLPEYNLAIECNPTCTHNSSVSDPWGGHPKSINYHKHKTDMCEKSCIFLFHIFGHEWNHKKEIILSMLKNLLKVNQNKIFARKCEVAEVNAADANMFLAANHRQGSVNSKVRLGLYFQGELVSLMTFGKMRNTIGTGTEDLEECWELVRFCSKLNTTVVGGADKLFKHFIHEFGPKTVRSFSDRSHTRGALYSKLGFNEIRRSESSYVWVNVVDDVAYNRVNAQKHHIQKFLDDDTIDLSKSERQIMEEHGYVRVYDSGTITWEWISS